MGWFDEQIRQRKLSDDEVFADSFADIAGAVAGRGFSDALKKRSPRGKRRHRRHPGVLPHKVP